MEICVKSFDGEKYTVEVGVDDTTADIRRKVASAAELCEDGFDMSFGEKLLPEGDDTTQLSAGDTVVLTKTKSQKGEAYYALRDLGETALTTQRFKGLEDPKLIHLFLRAEVVTEVPNEFLSGAPFSELDLSGVPGVTAVGHSFLHYCRALHTADLSGWSRVRQIGVAFLGSCYALSTLDLSGWRNVTQVDDRFLASLTSLTTANLSGWSRVAQVGIFFLADCSSLTMLDLSGWNSVTHIADDFVIQCSSLRTLDLSGWASVTHVGRGALKHCNVRKCSINVTGSSSVVSEYVQRRTKRECVCM